MSQPLLQVNFTLGVPAADYAQMCAGLADTFAAVPGLRWKTWILNEQQNEAHDQRGACLSVARRRKAGW